MSGHGPPRARKSTCNGKLAGPFLFKAPTCSMPFMAHQVQNQTREVEKPKATLRAAVAIRPPASSMVGEVREPSTPDTNLLRCREGCRAERRH